MFGNKTSLLSAFYQNPRYLRPKAVFVFYRNLGRLCGGLTERHYNVLSLISG
jgi:hypothetical protein